MEIIKHLIKIEPFNKVIKKIVLSDIKMDEKEREYLLTIAIIFLKEFDFNKNKGIYLEFAYFIILKYSLIYKDFLPLYDFSVNFGFYPIVSTIVENNLIEFNSLINFNLKNGIQENFKNNNNIIETLEQNKMRKFLFNNKINKNISIIAPTSFGKSNLIIENIKENLKLYKKIAIIVPTKSLLAQIYKDIKIQNLDRKIIIHDTMYQKENEFISILTQERALRLLNQNLFFDCLYIDEAHKILIKTQEQYFYQD
ncbi:DEAD/DEAH box helicase [Spiroplasma endosymbiont of Polydrusus pterygomalis]|uniref:DEAD/DEAH box helicase n=1 Tax=Spiroplasma endosymbiont of Polydrusus pterygomalis TaxID=3139327 RepID=UPI003CCB5D17